MADWKQLDLGFEQVLTPLSDGFSGVVGGLTGILGAGLAVLDVLASFLTSINSPLLAGVQLLKSQLLTLLADLEETGVYSLFMLPSSLTEISQYRGGYDQFRRQFITSFNDPNDPDRPQIRSSGSLGGIILYVNSESAGDLVLNARKFADFFARPLDLGFPAPINLTVRPAFGSALDAVRAPILDAFGTGPQPDALAFEWQEPRFANDLLYDIFAGSKFLLERSKSREGVLVLQSTSTLNTDPVTKRSETGPKANDPALTEGNEPLWYWDPVDPNDPFIELSDLLDVTDGTLADFNFLAGSYAYLLENVAPGLDNAFYYRVRAVPQDATLEARTVRAFGDTLEEDLTVYDVVINGETQPPNLFPASSPVLGYIPDVDYSFDLPTALLNVYRAAYAIRMDQDVYDGNGNLLPGSSALEVELPRALFEALSEVVEYPQDPFQSVLYVEDPLYPEGLYSFEDSLSEIRNARVAKADSFDFYGGVDEFLLPSSTLSPAERVRIEIEKKAEPQVRKLTTILAGNEGLFEAFRQAYTAAEAQITSVLTSGVGSADFLGTSSYRSSVYTLLLLFQGLTRAGTPPNWKSVKLLEELFPEASEALDILYNVIDSFEATFSGAGAELGNTIEGIQDRLAVLTALIEELDRLIASLSAFLALDFDVNVLYVPPSPGGNGQFLTEFINASNPPPSDPNDYYFAIALLAGGASAAEVQSIKNAFSIIFGV